MAKGKRGRPRKPPPFRDKGTPELRIRRAIIVNGGNPDKASDPIDACEERGIITTDMALAAHQYSTIYYKIFGKPFHSINYDKLLNRTEGFVNAASNPSRKESENEWIITECFHILNDLKVKKQIDDIAVRKIFPDFLFEDKAKASSNSLKSRIRTCLKGLDECFLKAKLKYKSSQKKSRS